MIKKIIHCADLHIRTFRMHEEYKEIFQLFINEIEDFMVEGNYKYDEVRVAIVGDLVHQKITISNEQLILSCWFLNELSKLCKVVIIAGNHDLLENNKDRVDSISPMIQLLDNENIMYFKESKCYVDDNVVWCNYSIFEGNSRPNIEESRKLHTDKTFIGLYHAPIAGATTDIGYEFDESFTPLTHFEGCNMVLCGDIHKRQIFNHKGIPIAMPSSLIQQNFGESISKHGYLIWDVLNKSYIEKDIETDYGFYQFKVNTLKDIENGTEKLTNG